MDDTYMKQLHLVILTAALCFPRCLQKVEQQAPRQGTAGSGESLLSNAIKFTTEGHISVDLVADDDKGVLRLLVSDTGKGVSPNHAEQIFERFYKEDSFVPGIGLGLSLVRIIAARMGGTVCLDTTYSGPGARFVVEVPFPSPYAHC